MCLLKTVSCRCVIIFNNLIHCDNFQALQEGIITHRGAGAFIEEDFVKKEPRDEDIPEPVNKAADDGSERAVIVESNLVKPSEKDKFLIDE